MLSEKEIRDLKESLDNELQRSYCSDTITPGLLKKEIILKAKIKVLEDIL